MVKNKPAVRKGKKKTPAEKGKVGRPPMFSNREDLQAAVNSYFDKCDAGIEVEVITKRGEVAKITKKTPYTVPGLAYHLGFSYRQAVWEYSHKEEFSDIITRALLRIQMQRNEQALTEDSNPKFAAFDLNANFGWTEKKTIGIEIPDKVPDEDQGVLRQIAKELGKRVVGK